jgi:hypothetical protein
LLAEKEKEISEVPEKKALDAEAGLTAWGSLTCNDTHSSVPMN